MEGKKKKAEGEESKMVRGEHLHHAKSEGSSVEWQLREILSFHIIKTFQLTHFLKQFVFYSSVLSLPYINIAKWIIYLQFHTWGYINNPRYSGKCDTSLWGS